MTDRVLHIVSFNIPWPADYGGVIDVFYKIKALHQAGVKIILHCFEYGRAHADELNKYCTEVHYYKRKTGVFTWMSPHPYIVAGRTNAELIQRLKQDEHPILLEGIHCAGFLLGKGFERRQIFIRAHNVEHDYYTALAHAERSMLKRFYFRTEARRLKKFEPVLECATVVFAISPKDAADLTSRYSNIVLIPAFHAFEKVKVPTGLGKFALYHGNLGVGENDAAALFLVREVFRDLNVPLIIAGNSPSGELKKAVEGSKNIELRTSLSSAQLFEYVHNAQVNVLPTFQATGIKLKLLAALYSGRHVVVNPPMVKETGLESLCTVSANAEEMKKEIVKLFTVEMDRAEEQRRAEVLGKLYSNQRNAQLLINSVNWFR